MCRSRGRVRPGQWGAKAGQESKLRRWVGGGEGRGGEFGGWWGWGGFERVVMKNSAAALAAIPPASYIGKQLHLKSRLPRRDGDVTVCTQCSLDRLERVEAQTRCWSGVLCVAVMCPCPCTRESVRTATRRVRALHARVEAKGGLCRLDIILASHLKLLSCRDPWQYPINALRNVALRFAATELVILLDVDFLPGLGIQEQLWKMDVYSGYLRACTDLRRVVVLPALEEPSDSANTSTELSSVNRNYLQSALQIVSAGKINVASLLNQGKLKAFASEIYPAGHGPTDTERWSSSTATYEVQYKDNYEPYFLCARRLVSWYDERFTGYGRNKMIHAFHIAGLDFRFWIHPEWYVVHVDHLHSAAWQATLGSDPLANQRLTDVKLLYREVQDELVRSPSHTGICLFPEKCAQQTPLRSLFCNTWCTWQIKRHGISEEQMGHWSCADKPSSLLLQMSSKEYLRALYDLRFHFCTPKLCPVAPGWPLRSRLPRGPRDISLVTVATPDRLHRLSAQCRQWKGVICAVVYAIDNLNVEALKIRLRQLHQEVEEAGTCRLDLLFVESAQVNKEGRCCTEQTITPKYCTCGSQSLGWSDLCPINSLRNAALGMATTDLVFILDVDLLPAPSLNDCFLDERQYKCLWRMTMEERIAVVVPSFEYTLMSPETRTRRSAGENSWAGNDEDRPYQQARVVSSGFEVGKGHNTSQRESIVEEERCIAHTEEMAGRGVQAICNGLTSGSLSGFHMKHYPQGHGPTDFERWRENSQNNDSGREQCCKVCESYTVTFEEGFEPFSICSRKLIPMFDERFRGYGYDKVTFFYNLHLSGFRFRVLLHSFALDIPHAKSPDWIKTFGVNADPLQCIRVTALYRRAKRELNLISGMSAQQNGATDHWATELMKNGIQSAPIFSRSYRHLHISHTSGGKHNRPNLEELQLVWQGVIRPLCSHDETCSNQLQIDEPLHILDSEEKMTATVFKEIAKPPQESCISRGASLQMGDDETKDYVKKLVEVKERTGCMSGWFGWVEDWVARSRKVNFGSNCSDSKIWTNTLEEIEWESAGWELKCSSDSLANCSVVKVPERDSVRSRVLFDKGGYWLRISMSAGSWSPQASRLAGITTGGVSVRSVLPIRSVHEVVVRYMVRFPTSFVWNKGGTLPGFWLGDLLQINFGWRRAGEGHLSIVLTGQSYTESGQERADSTIHSSRLSRPFYFVPGQWHALQLAVSVVHQKNTCCQDPANGTPSMRNAAKGKPSSSQNLNQFEHFQDGAMLELEASVDFEPVSTVRGLTCKQRPPSLTSSRQEPRAGMGLLLSCYFGGKTQDWACTEDSHIDFGQFELWTD